MSAKPKQGETAKLYCEHCSWSTDVPMAATDQSQRFHCAHCGASLFWHRCPSCGLGYVGEESPSCPACDDASLDDISFE